MPKGVHGVHPPCKIEGCERLAYGHGWCQLHWNRWRRHGDPLGKATRPTVEQRFWANVNKSDGCWEWTASRNTSGYGQFNTPMSTRTLAHRFAWSTTHGPIPSGLFVCHHCDNPPCVRPDHLFLGTHADNMADAAAKGRAKGPTRLDTCRAGHPINAENAYITPDGRRDCRVCRRLSAKRYRDRRSA